MSDKKCKTCEEYSRLSRRQFMTLSTGMMAAAAAPAWLPRVVFADSESSTRDIIISIFLRGGADSLSLCVPHGDDHYYNLRPTVSVPRPGSTGGALDLDGFFGFAPAMSPLLDAYQNGDLLVVHATGLPEAKTRSHFDAMANMESGADRPPAFAADGWLGRHLRGTAPSSQSGFLRAIGIGYGLQHTLVGAPRTLPVADLAEFGFPGEQDRREALERLYDSAPEVLKLATASTLNSIDVLEQIDFRSYRPSGGVSYPFGDFGTALASTAALIKADVGVEAIAIDLGGWDTHSGQGTTGGYLNNLMRQFASGLSAFHQDLFASNHTNVIVTVMSEFGRNSRENGSEGTDHGHGGAMFVLGSAVNGGRVLTEWPGLGPGQLYENQDLDITIDYRDVLSEILTKRLDNTDIRAVFPSQEYVPKELGIIA